MILTNVRYTNEKPDPNFESRRPVHIRKDYDNATLCGINLRQGYIMKNVGEAANCKACLLKSSSLSTETKPEVKPRKKAQTEQASA